MVCTWRAKSDSLTWSDVFLRNFSKSASVYESGLILCSVLNLIYESGMRFSLAKYRRYLMNSAIVVFLWKFCTSSTYAFTCCFSFPLHVCNMSSLRVWYSRKFQRLFKQKKNSLKLWKGFFCVIIFLTAVLSFFSMCIAVSLSITSSTAPSLHSNSFRAAVWISAKRLSKFSICDSVSKVMG